MTKTPLQNDQPPADAELAVLESAGDHLPDDVFCLFKTTSWADGLPG
jgi:hypothetical protein